MKVIQLLLYLLVIIQSNHGQNAVLQNQYLFNPLLINPAYAGGQKEGEVQVMYKKYLSGFDNAPISKLFSIHTPIPKKRIGLGLNVFSDSNGGSGFKGAEASFAYHINYDTVDLKDSKYHLSFGISSTINQVSIDRANLFGVEVTDPILSNRKLSSASGNANIGLLLFNRGFSIGLSIYNIIPIPNKLYTSILEPKTSPLVFIQSGYQLPVGEQFTITPSLMFHTQQNANYTLDVNLGFAYHINNKDFVQLITSYKSFSENLSKGSQAIAMNIQMVFSSFFVGFHFEIPTSIVSNYTSGGHAIQFGYKFQEGKPKLLQSQLEEF